MQNKHDGILRSINKNISHINILTCPTHEAYQTNWETLKHKFYMVQDLGNTKPWDYWSRPVPRNHMLLSNKFIPSNIFIDMVLSQNKFGQAQFLSQYVKIFSCPWINIEHTWPHPDYNIRYIQQLRETLTPDLNIFISEASANAWLYDSRDPKVEIIRHGVNTDVFKPVSKIHRQDHVLCVANDYINRDWCLGFSFFVQAQKRFKIRAVGNTPGLSEPTQNQEQLINEYNQCAIFLNTSTYSPIPMSLLEAASCGCPIVSNNTCAISDLIEHGVNGLLFNTIDEMNEHLQWMLKHPDEAQTMGDKARRTIEDKFNLKDHVEKWDNIINQYYRG